MRTSLALAAAGLLLVAVPALAAERSDRDRITSSPSVPAPQIPAPAPAHNGGSIQSHASVSTNSGGNQGSNVVTGDQSATVTVVNVGPTSQNTQVISPAPQQNPAPQCSGRACPRTR